MGTPRRSAERWFHRIPFRGRNSAPETVPFDRTGISVRTGIETACEALIRNRHFYPPTIAPIPRVSGSSYSLDYANRWRSPHTDPACHGDQKSCSTRREISSPAKELGITFRPGIGIAYVTTIRNRHSETVGTALVSRNSVPGPKFHPGASVIVHRHRTIRLDGDICQHGAKELGITFRPGIGIVYVTTIRNRHSETVGTALVFRNSVPGPKFRPGACVPTTVPFDRTGISVRTGVGTAPEAPIQSRHFDSVGRWFRGIPFRGRNSAPERVLYSTPTAVPFDRTGISVRMGVGTAPEAPIQNLHFDPDCKRSHSEISDPA
ncbi:hypothetical protein Taro_019226 [Colocasia esculenta]|uniref:Uncharacterized protein n=1 Tax=Colocasia esculenta TaxID=4460 RepID=A0A843V4V7_COLES|nr:hypothetical protein [Colocasia esculenta]